MAYSTGLMVAEGSDCPRSAREGLLFAALRAVGVAGYTCCMVRKRATLSLVLAGGPSSSTFSGPSHRFALSVIWVYVVRAEKNQRVRNCEFDCFDCTKMF